MEQHASHGHAGEAVTGNKRRRIEETESARRTPRQQSPEQLSDPAPYPRKRVSVACDICRIRKRKCDLGKPSCSFCASRGVACIYRKSSVVLANLMTKAKQGEKFQMLQTRLENIEIALSNSQIISPPLSEGPVQSVAASMPRSAFSHEIGIPQPPAGTPQSECVPRLSSPNAIFAAADVVAARTHLPRAPGFSMLGFSHLAKHLAKSEDSTCVRELQGLDFDDSEEYIESELHQNDLLHRLADPNTVDLSDRKCWSYQQAFARHMLPWFPLFSQDYTVHHVNVAREARFSPTCPSTPLALYVLALGAFSRADLITGDNPSEFPGLNYFAAARNITGPEGLTYAIEVVQSQILRTLYLMMCMRPLMATESISTASRTMIALLHLKRHLNSDPLLSAACHRAYWACYIIEHELKPYSSVGTPGIEDLHKVIEIPLPLATHDEPGMLWFLSEIALRRIFSEVYRPDFRTPYEPIVTNELYKQLVQWYRTLPPGIKFNLDTKDTSDQQRAFLRAQYYAVLVVSCWSSVVRLFAQKSHNPAEHNILIENSVHWLEYCVMYVQTVEYSCFERHVLLFANFIGTYCMTLMMLCAYGTPQFDHLQHIELGSARIDLGSAIQKGYRILSPWSANPNVASKVRRLEVLMRDKGLEPSRPLRV